VPPFVANVFARQLDVSSLISAGVSVASSLLPEITSALSVQLTVIPDSTGGQRTVIITDTAKPAASTTAPSPSVTTTSIRSTATPIFTTSNTAASITSKSLSPITSALATTLPKSTSSSGHHSSNVGLIVGVVIGVLAALLLALLLFCCLRRRRQGKKNFIPFFSKRRGSSSTISKDSDFGNSGPAVRSKDLETAEKYRTNPTVPVPAVVAGRRSASPADNPFDDSNRSPPLHRSTLDPVTEAPEGYTDQYTDGYGWGESGAPARRGGRLAGLGHQRKPTPDPNSEPGRTHFGLLDYETTPPPSRGIGLNSGGGNKGTSTNDALQDNRDSLSYYGRSWDEVDAVTKRPPPGQHF